MKYNGPNDAAFPSPYCPDTDNGGEPGLTVREWYAGMALQGIINGGNFQAWKLDGIAKLAFDVADAMLAEAKKGGNRAP